jgi:amidase
MMPGVIGSEIAMRRRDFLLYTLATCELACESAGAAAQPGLDPFGSAAGAAAAIAKKQVSAVELTRHCLDRQVRYDPSLHAFVQVYGDWSLARAKEADAALARKQIWGPLHGVPVSIKECFAYRETVTSAGIPALKDFKPKGNAVLVDRLEKGGAIIVGKTNVPEALSDYQSFNDVYRVTSNNPYDLMRTPGGSTGGGAAALAAGMGYLTFGSDIGGSIRVPAHFCGLYGHKPTIDLVPLRGHVPPTIEQTWTMPNLLLVAGPLARSADDLKLALEVVGGPDGPDTKALHYSMPRPRAGRLKDFRVGVPPDDSWCPLSSEIRSCYENAVAQIEKSGAKVVPGWPAGFQLETAFRVYNYLVSSATARQLSKEEEEQMRQAYEKNPQNPRLAAYVGPASEMRTMTQELYVIRATWERFFQNFDVFLSPVDFVAAFPHDHSSGARQLHTPEGPRSYSDQSRWIFFQTLTGNPATVAPVGRTASGLPCGIQIMGPFFEDGTSIAFAGLLRERLGGFVAPKDFA